MSGLFQVVADFAARDEGCPREVALAIQRCVSSKGARQGWLVKGSPGKATPFERGVWSSLMSSAAPARVGIATIIMAGPEMREGWDQAEAWQDRRVPVDAQDHIGVGTFVALLAGRPLEFNLHAMRMDPEVMSRFLAKAEGSVPRR